MDFTKQVNKLTAKNFVQENLSIYGVSLLTPRKDDLYEWLIMIFGLIDALSKFMPISTRF